MHSLTSQKRLAEAMSMVGRFKMRSMFMLSIYKMWCYSLKQDTYEEKKEESNIVTQSYYDHYTTLTDFSTKYLTMCMVYNDVGGIK